MTETLSLDLTVPLKSDATPLAPAISPAAAPEAAVEAKPMSAEQIAIAAERELHTQLKVRKRRERLSGIVQNVVPGLVGVMLFLLLWQGVAQTVGNFPGPAKVWDSAVKLFSDPFYRKGPNDQGIGWNIIASLQRVGIGFWMWDEWNNLVMEHIIVAIFTIGIVGLLLEQALIWVAKRFQFD